MQSATPTEVVHGLKMTPAELVQLRARYATVLKRMELYDAPDLEEYVSIQLVGGQPELMLSQKGLIQAAKFAPDREGAERLIKQALRASANKNGLLDIPYHLKSNPFTFIKADM